MYIVFIAHRCSLNRYPSGTNLRKKINETYISISSLTSNLAFFRGILGYVATLSSSLLILGLTFEPLTDCFTFYNITGRTLNVSRSRLLTIDIHVYYLWFNNLHVSQ